MLNELDTSLQSIDSATLTPLVRGSLGSETAEVINWEIHQVHGGGTHAGVYRLSGDAHDGGETITWSLILKVIQRQPDRDDPLSPFYWKRQVLAYQSGILEDLPGGLVAARCFDIVEYPDGVCWLWLEEVKDEIGVIWPLEHYGIVARHLGQFNGAFLVGRPLPSEPWLSKGWLRSLIARDAVATGIAQLRNSLEYPLVHYVYPPDVAEGFLRLWAGRDTFLDTIDSLPQAFCHLDAFKRNLFSRQSDHGVRDTVAIDWAFAGTGAVGEELVPLVTGSLYYRAVEWDKALELDNLVFDGYLEGLHDAGWRGDPRAVRFGYVTASALRYGLGYIRWCVSALLDEDVRTQETQVVGCSVEELVDDMAKCSCFLFTLAEEAQGLLDKLK